MTQPPQQPPTQVFAQQRRSGCGMLLVALLVGRFPDASVHLRRMTTAAPVRVRP
jgi:hypothetical protein